MQGNNLFASKRKSKDINRIFVIIPAAGKSERMGEGTDKLFIDIAGKPVIQRTLEAFASFAKDLEKSNIAVKVIVVTSATNNFQVHKLVKNNNYSFVHSVIIGGATRTESVWKGLEELDNMPIPPRDNDIVFIHDGARCLVSDQILDNCLEGILYNDICAAAVPAKNTIKKIDTVKPEEEAPAAPEAPAPAEAAAPEAPAAEEKKPASKEEIESIIKDYPSPFKAPSSAAPKNTSPLGAAVRPGSAASGSSPFKPAPSTSGSSPFAPIPEEDTSSEKNSPVWENDEGPISKHPSKFSRPVGFNKAAILFNPNPNPPPKAAAQIRVESTPKRDELMEVQTPQVFRYNKLIESYANAMRNGITGTDDTELAERLHYKVTLVEGSYSNIKITTPEDVAMAEAIIKEQEKEA